MASPVIDTWMHSTVLIDNGWGGRGTGFLITRPTDEEFAKVFLVTNKHVLDEDAATRRSLTSIELHLNVERAGEVVGERVEYSICGAGSEPLWREHPEYDVDVLAIDLTPLIAERSDLSYMCAPYNVFVERSDIEEFHITAGDEVLVVGYPLGLRQGLTNYPLVRQGIIATHIGEELHEEVQQPNRSISTRRIRGFLIDGATIPGSSGSPVLLKQNPGSYYRGKYLLGESNPQFLLGIIAETRYAPLSTPSGETQGFAGLGLAFDALTVRETIECFFD